MSGCERRGPSRRCRRPQRRSLLASAALLSASILPAVAVGLAASRAGADTRGSVWERVQDPQRGARDAVHAEVEQAIETAGRAPHPVLRAAALERARDALVEAHAERSSDPRLLFDLGEVYELIGEHERAATILTRALKEAPNAPGATQAIESLSFAYAYLDRPQEERATYFAFLARATEELSKATATLNLAEAEMRLGNLTEAVARYREAAALAAAGVVTTSSSTETTRLATWGLAVALDRAGDTRAAEEAALLATQLDPGERTIEFGERVFFVPAYERDWYLGLGMAEEAKAATEPHFVERFWRSCEAHWAAYVHDAAPTEPWLPLARRHYADAHAHAELARARVKAADAHGKWQSPWLDPPVIKP